MSRKCLLALVLSTLYVSSIAQQNFSIPVTNSSKEKVYYRLFKNRDSILPGQTVTISEPADTNASTVFLLIDATKRFRYITLLYSHVKGRKVQVTNDTILFVSNSSEKLFEYYERRKSEENRWTLADSIIKRNKDDLASAEIIRNFLCNNGDSPDSVQPRFDLLSDRLRKTRKGADIAQYILGCRALKEGTIVADFSLPDTTATKRNLYSVTSDYVLIDFWFSHCVPCIESFPDLIKLYEKTDRKKLEIIGISIDAEKLNDLWKSTIVKHGIPWINVNDPAYSISWKRFSIQLYPAKILLDKDHRIVSVNPGIDEIEAILNHSTSSIHPVNAQPH